MARLKPTPAGVIAVIAIALSLGGTAWAAKKISGSQIQKNTITSANLKNRKAVKGADVTPGAVNGATIADGSLRGSAFTPGSVPASAVNVSSTKLGQRIATLGGPVNRSLTSSVSYMKTPKTTFTQAGGGPDLLFSGSAKVTFSGACVQPRSAVVYVLIDDPVLSPYSILGYAVVPDTGSGAVSKSFQVGPYPGAVNSARFPAPVTDQEHQLFLYATVNCSSGSGATLDSFNGSLVGAG